jgi:predicted porin
MSFLSRLPMRFVLAAALSLAPSLVAHAATPEKDHAAIGGDFGLFAPFESADKLGFQLQGNVDYYLERRYGVRATIGYAQSGSDYPDNPKSSRAYFLASGLYNWEMGAFHPFAVAGLGIYHVSPAVGGSSVRVGVHAGAGVDYYLDRRTAVTGQVLFHFLSSVADQKSSFAGVSLGLRYFF